MKHKFIRWIEENYFQNPSFLAHLISIILLPITLIYCVVVAFKRSGANPRDFGIKVISIGNLIAGGSGKTPLAIALAKKYANPAIILRGYGRISKGLFVVSKNGEILENISTSGDEAMLLAKSLPNATVIVCEDRKMGILKAKEIGCEIVFLDDGFSKHDIKKFNILIRPKNEPQNIFCIPSGPYREPKFLYSLADLVLEDGVDFQRVVTFKQNGAILVDLPQNLVVITAISKPSRLQEFLPQNSIIESFADHHIFLDDEIEKIFQTYPNYSFATTAKDMVKLEKYSDKFILLDLELQLQNEISFSHINH